MTTRRELHACVYPAWQVNVRLGISCTPKTVAPPLSRPIVRRLSSYREVHRWPPTPNPTPDSPPTYQPLARLRMARTVGDTSEEHLAETRLNWLIEHHLPRQETRCSSSESSC